MLIIEANTLPFSWIDREKQIFGGMWPAVVLLKTEQEEKGLTYVRRNVMKTFWLRELLNIGI